MNELFVNLNWIGLIIGAVIAFSLGGLWYSPHMFGLKWAEGSGINIVDDHPLPALLVQGIGTFLFAWLLAIVLVSGGLAVAILAVITVSAILAGGCLFSNKNSYAVITESGFVVVNGVIIIACLYLIG